MTAPALDMALKYGAYGWPVFAVPPGCKAPFPGSRGFKDATTRPDLIRWWFTHYPDANVAIATGAPGPDVLDIDHKPSGSGFESLNRLKRAGLLAGAMAIIRTPSGGVHVYYQGTAQRGSTLKGLYVDFRAAGGYVVAPPSVVDERAYPDEPERASTVRGGRPYEVVDKRDGDAATAVGQLDWQAVKNLLLPPRLTPPHRPGGGGGGDIGSLAAWVAGLPEGNRNAGLFWAACKAMEQGCTDLRPLANAAMQAGLPDTEAWRTVSSAERRAVS